MIQAKAAVANRIQKILEDANIKLGSVATDVLGKSGRAMLRAIIAGQDDPTVLAELALRKLRAKIPQLRAALRGGVTENHRFLLKLLGASSQSSFVNAIYGVSAPLVAPFHGIFPNTGSSGNVFEPAALVAIAVFALLGWGAVMLIRIATAPRGTRPATS